MNYESSSSSFPTDGRDQFQILVICRTGTLILTDVVDWCEKNGYTIANMESGPVMVKHNLDGTTCTLDNTTGRYKLATIKKKEQ